MVRANILIVEDELLIAKSLAKKLIKIGYNIVKIVATGREAIQCVREVPLDLILMDVAIKGKIDGIETANKIKNIADVPIVFLTAYANDETIERASKTGCYGYLIKPFRDKELQATVQMTLSKHRQYTGKKATQSNTSKNLAKSNNAYRDEITNLPNRLFLKDLFAYLSSLADTQTAIATGINDNLQLKPRLKPSNFKLIAVFNIYLDRFEQNTSCLSQSQVDSLLKQTARRLSDCVNSFETHGATIYMESDNFVVLLALDTRLTATKYGQIIARKLSESLVVEEREIVLSHQIGIAFCPSDSMDIEELLQQSKKAIQRGLGGFPHPKGYRDPLERLHQEAIANGTSKSNSTLHMFTRASKLDSKDSRKQKLRSELYQALKHEQLELYYLPEVDFKTNQIVSAEALVQWNHPQVGIIKADKLIFLADKIGLLEPITEWIFQTVCQQIRTWQNAGLGYLKVGVNLSSNRLLRLMAVEITHALADFPLESKNLILEVTAKTLNDDFEAGIESLSTLKKIGVQTALNLKSNHSSLSQIQQFSFDVLKIDSSFIQNVASDRLNSMIAENIELAHRLGSKVVATGVKTPYELRLLENFQCDAMQSLLSSRPLNAEEFQQLVERSELRNSTIDRCNLVCQLIVDR